jgi:regulator of protease activity HflC (stomatin/prohibitin superfamily)
MSVIIAVVIVVLFLLSGVKILKEYERAVIFRLGRVTRALINPGGSGMGPGLIIVIPGIDQVVKVPLRTVTMDVPSQDVITRDNVSVKVNAIIYFRVIDHQRAILEVEDYLYATSQIAQTTLRSVLGQSQLDDLLAKREEINAELQRIIDQQTEPWGIKVAAVEVKNVDLPQEMVRAIARQAEAERDRRAKVIHAEGEFQAAQKLLEAADIMSRNTTTLQLRYLQTLTEIAAENNSTTIFPVPIDLFSAFLRGPAK